MKDQLIMDALADEQPAEAPEFATWSDLCEGGRLVDKFYAQLGKTIRFNTYIPMEEGLKLTKRFGMDNSDPRKRNSEAYMFAVLELVMVNPRLTQADRHIARKAHMGVLFDILKEVLGEDTESYKSLVSDLGPQ